MVLYALVVVAAFTGQPDQVYVEDTELTLDDCKAEIRTSTKLAAGFAQYLNSSSVVVKCWSMEELAIDEASPFVPSPADITPAEEAELVLDALFNR